MGLRTARKPRCRSLRFAQGWLLLGAIACVLLLGSACGRSQPSPLSEPASRSPTTPSPDPSPVASPKTTQTDASLLAQPGLAQSVKFERITQEDGLSQGTILCILQDSLGFMWFCTEDGLNRYDGYEFTVYRHDPDDPDSLGEGPILSVLEDLEGRLWVWRNRGGLDRFDRDEKRFIHYDLFDRSTIAEEGTDFVWTVYVDPTGVVWAGTYRNGLHRYDTQEDRFVRYRNDPDDLQSLSSDRVYAIYEDRQGRLWVGTMGGLNRLDDKRERFTQFRHSPGDPESLGADVVQQILEDRSGRFWVTTFGVGLEQINPDTGRVLARYQHEPDESDSIDETTAITAVYEDQMGWLWLTHFDGRLDSFDPDAGTFVRHRHDPDNPRSLSSNDVSFVMEGKAGALWVGTADGLNQYIRETGEFIHYSHDPSDPQSLSSSYVTEFYEDRAGVLWIGTAGKGVNLYDPRGAKFPHYRIEVEGADRERNNVVNAIYQDSVGTVWVGTDAGLNRFQSETPAIPNLAPTGSSLEGRTFVHYQHDPGYPASLSPGYVASVFEDREGRLWIGTQTGLDLLDRETDQFTHYEQVTPDAADLSIGAVVSITQDRSGALWLGRHRYGLCKFDPETGKCTAYAYNPDDPICPQDMVSQVYEDQGGQLWLATQGGLLAFDYQSGAYTPYEHSPDDPHSLSHNSVSAIHEDCSGQFWVATDGGGLNRFDISAGSFTRWTERDGLPSNRLLGILEESPPLEGPACPDRPTLWLSTSDGLTRFDPDLEAFRNYDTGDGLQGGEFVRGAYYQAPSGEMFFGGLDGFNAFHPEQIQDNPYVPPVVLTALTQGGTEFQKAALGRAVERIEDATIRWPNNFFEFEFAALSYSQPQKNQYAYRLEGFRDESWNYVGTKRFGRYTNLPGGTYTLRLKGSNSDGTWNEEGVSIQITVVPPFWETWFFRGLLGVILVAAVFVGYRLRVRNMETRGQKLEEQVYNRTRELAALNAIAAVVSRSLDTQQILDDALTKTLEVTGNEAGGIYLLDVSSRRREPHEIESSVLKIAATSGLDRELVKGIDNLVVGEGFSGRVVQTCEPLVVQDLSADPRLTRSVVRAAGFHFLAIAPLVSRAKVLGTLFVMSRELRGFTQQDTDLLTSVAGQIGVAVENTHLFKAEQHRAELFRMISEVGRHITSILDPGLLLQTIVQEIQDTLGTYMVGIGLIEDEELVIRAAAGSDAPAPDIPPLHVKVGGEGAGQEPYPEPGVGTSQGITGWVATTGQALLVSDVLREPRYVQWPPGARTRSELVVPLKTKSGIIGVLNLESDEPDAFDDSDLMILQTLANQAAVAIENARLYEDTESRLAQITALQETAMAVASILELEELLHLITQQATVLLKAEGGILNLVDWDRREDVAVACVGTLAFVQDVRTPLDEGLSGWVALHNQAVIADQVQRDERINQEELDRIQKAIGRELRNAIAAPLTVKDQVVGTLVLLDKHGGKREFDQADLELLTAFANQAATAIHNARLFEAEQRRAEQFRVIAQVGHHLPRLLDVAEILNEVTCLIQQAFGYYHVGIGLIEGDQVVYRAGAGELWKDQPFDGIRPRLKVGEEGITGWVAASGEPLLVPDVTQEPRYLWMEPSRTRSELTVPLTIKGEVIGVLDVQSDRLNAFDDTDLAVLQSLANQVGTAIENARLHEQTQQAAVMEERSRLARDLHDAVTQTLFSASLIAEAVPSAWDIDPQEGRQLLSELRQLTRGALAEMRTLLLELRPSALVETNLVDLLHQLAEAASGRAGFPIAVTVDGTAPFEGRALPTDVHIALYRIAQEALNNVVKHSRASQVTVSLRSSEEIHPDRREVREMTIELRVRDDGRGFEPGLVSAEHLGLGIMRERAEAIGARLEIDTRVGHGTTVVAVWTEQVETNQADS